MYVRLVPTSRFTTKFKKNIMVHMEQIELIATTTFGLETVVKHEITDLGYTIIDVQNGKITFAATMADIPRVNLWLRSADRVKWRIGEFKAVTFEQLFELTKALPWTDILPENACFPVIGKSVKSTLFSISDCQAIAKKAIVENMKARYKLDWFPEDGPEYKIEVALLKDIVTLSIDTSGQGLHKRGYRYLHIEAPIKETMAAGLLQLTRWKPDRPYWDPFCGSGTFPIEAAMIAKNLAPGLNRSFASQYWPNIALKDWEQAVDEALDLVQDPGECHIYGTDIDPEAVRLSKHNAAQAEVDELITFEQRAFGDVRPGMSYGYCMANPPYGERMSDEQEVEQLYKQIGEGIRQHWSTWSVYMFTSHPDFETLFGRKATKKRKLYSGNIRCDFYQFFGQRPPKKTK